MTIDTEKLADLLKITAEMRTNDIANYVIPQLTSSLIGGPGKGQVRLLTSQRETREWVTPHSHRFDFSCLVLKGLVTNRLFKEVPAREASFTGAEKYARSFLETKPGLSGETLVLRETATLGYYAEDVKQYSAGQVYSMNFFQIHSIQFSRGAVVLFFEGPELRENSVILEPVADDDRIIETFRVHPWMFEKE